MKKEVFLGAGAVIVLAIALFAWQRQASMPEPFDLGKISQDCENDVKGLVELVRAVRNDDGQCPDDVVLGAYCARALGRERDCPDKFRRECNAIEQNDPEGCRGEPVCVALAGGVPEGCAALEGRDAGICRAVVEQNEIYFSDPAICVDIVAQAADAGRCLEDAQGPAQISACLES